MSIRKSLTVRVSSSTIIIQVRYDDFPSDHRVVSGGGGWVGGWVGIDVPLCTKLLTGSN